MLFNRNTIQATHASHIHGFKFSGSYFKKWKEIDEVIFDNLFYLTQCIQKLPFSNNQYNKLLMRSFTFFFFFLIKTLEFCMCFAFIALLSWTQHISSAHWLCVAGGYCTELGEIDDKCTLQTITDGQESYREHRGSMTC